MIFLHALAAVLACWRLTELFTQDRITQPLRDKFRSYLWQCPRCMSVWTGGWCALVLALAPVTHGLSPWLNWPFALAYLYLWHLEAAVVKRVTIEGRRFVVEGQGQQWTLTRNDFNPGETQEILGRLMMTMQPPPQPQPPQPPSYTNGAMR